MHYPKVLLTAPVSSHKAYVLYDWIREVKTKLTYPSYDILLVDNSDNLITTQRIASEGVNCMHVDKGFRDIREVMAICNNVSRTWALNYGYDFIFSLECDVFPPADVIERLLAHQKQVVSGFYFTDQYQDIRPMVEVYEFSEEINWGYARSWSILEGFHRCSGKLVRVANAGMGCLLIHRSIFSAIEFRVDLTQDTHADSLFSQDCMLSGIPVWLDSSIICKHFNSSWMNIYDTEDRRARKAHN